MSDFQIIPPSLDSNSLIVDTVLDDSDLQTAEKSDVTVSLAKDQQLLVKQVGDVVLSKYGKATILEITEDHSVDDTSHHCRISFGDRMEVEVDAIELELIPKMKVHSNDAAGCSISASVDSIPLKIFWHPACVKHNIPDHPEQPARVIRIFEALRGHFTDESIFCESRRVSLEEILMFHTQSHLDQFSKVCAVPEEIFAKSKKVTYNSIDGDTRAMHLTREAALRSAGAVITAIDAIYNPGDSGGTIRTAFCAVRPPGHHSEKNRACGFCFLNNVGIGAKYAQRKYGVDRVAVIDFDVHHGNGTEEGFEGDESLFFGSTHELGNFPGTGRDPTPFIGDKVKKSIHRRIVDRTIRPGPKSREDFRLKWPQVIEEMILFRPSLVIISAGFDAHDDDPLSSTELTVEDFIWATDVILEACVRINPQSPPPIVSSLEGGYDLDALAACALAHTKCLAKGYPVLSDSIPSGDEVAALTEHIKSLGVL